MNAAPTLPETILQFGAGRFLRAFVDRFVEQANAAGQEVGRVVVVQSTAGQRADLLNAQPQGFHVVVRGLHEGRPIDRVEPVRSVSRALSAVDQWPAVLQFARTPALRLIVTNATEAGYAVEPAEQPDSAPPASMPAKLTRVLWERFEAGGSPLTIIPCELIEGNATLLRGIVQGIAAGWHLSAAFIQWATQDCLWLDTLVDCIVTPGPADHPLQPSDALLVTAEPYRLWAIARPAGRDPGLFTHPAIELVDDVGPYYLRKVRILNGLHTAMAARYQPLGFQTVLEVLQNHEAVRWLRDVAFEEIVPTIAYRVQGAALFADQVFERFANPYLAHRLADIANNHAAKVAVRLLPTVQEYQRLFGRRPTRLGELLGPAG